MFVVLQCVAIMSTTHIFIVVFPMPRRIHLFLIISITVCRIIVIFIMTVCLVVVIVAPMAIAITVLIITVHMLSSLILLSWQSFVLFFLLLRLRL